MACLLLRGKVCFPRSVLSVATSKEPHPRHPRSRSNSDIIMLPVAARLPSPAPPYGLSSAPRSPARTSPGPHSQAAYTAGSVIRPARTLAVGLVALRGKLRTRLPVAMLIEYSRHQLRPPLEHMDLRSNVHLQDQRGICTMPTYCSACRKSLSRGDLKCPWCGLPLTAMATRGTYARPSAALLAYRDRRTYLDLPVRYQLDRAKAGSG